MRIPKLNEVTYYKTFPEMIDSLFSSGGAKPVISWFNRKGEEYEVSGSDLLARAFCHEIDHLDGKLFIDCMIEELEE